MLRWISYKKYGLRKWQIIALTIFILFGLLHKYIANDKYLICIDGQEAFFAQKSLCNIGLPALIPYSPNTVDKRNRNIGPFDNQNVPSLYYRHWLGTDMIGRDVLAGIIHGFHIALKIGFISIFLATLIGSLLGYLSGYIGDNGFRPRLIPFCLSLIVILLSLFYFVYGSVIIKVIASVIVLMTVAILIKTTHSESRLYKTIAIPFDMIVMRFIELIKAIPDIFIILVLVAMFRKANFMNIILIITIVRWPSITRYLRAEILKVKEAGHVLAAKALGLSETRIFIDHILPLAFSPVIIASAFGFSTAILLESTLSFLGIGIPVDQVTWGSILNGARQNFSSWWLALFPGLMIYLSILLFNSLGDNLSEFFRKGRE